MAITVSTTKVDVSAGMLAAGRLQSLLDSGTAQPDLAELRAEGYPDRRGSADDRPHEMWAEILSKLNDYERPSRDIYDDSDDIPEAYEPDDFDGSSYDY